MDVKEVVRQLRDGVESACKYPGNYSVSIACDRGRCRCRGELDDEAAALLEALSADAARYQWLRDRPSFIGWDYWDPRIPNDANITPEFMDAAIDAAMEVKHE